MFFRREKIEEKNDYPISQAELTRLQASERFKYDETLLFGKKIKIADSTSFLGSLEEIFRGEIYKFKTESDSVTIIDCGANIGLATLYFKRLFPNARIIAYEPDPNIFAIMRNNIDAFGFDGIILKNEAISNKEGEVNFHLEGGHSGMIVQNTSETNVVPVRCARLKNILSKFEEVTFLKIDIEGHENEVIFDIEPELKKVQYLFLEYHSFMDSNQQLGEILNTITRAGMRYYLKEAYNKPLPFINREIFLNMDFLVNIFCYRA